MAIFNEDSDAMPHPDLTMATVAYCDNLMLALGPKPFVDHDQ